MNIPRQQQKSQLQTIFPYFFNVTTATQLQNENTITHIEFPFTSYQEGFFFFLINLSDHSVAASLLNSLDTKGQCSCPHVLKFRQKSPAKKLQNTKRTKSNKTEQEHLTLPRATKEGFSEKLVFRWSQKMRYHKGEKIIGRKKSHVYKGKESLAHIFIHKIQGVRVPGTSVG